MIFRGGNATYDHPAPPHTAPDRAHTTLAAPGCSTHLGALQTAAVLAWGAPQHCARAVTHLHARPSVKGRGGAARHGTARQAQRRVRAAPFLAPPTLLQAHTQCGARHQPRRAPAAATPSHIEHTRFDHLIVLGATPHVGPTHKQIAGAAMDAAPPSTPLLRALAITRWPQHSTRHPHPPTHHPEQGAPCALRCAPSRCWTCSHHLARQRRAGGGRRLRTPTRRCLWGRGRGTLRFAVP
jgi:hypothetical protein